MNLFKLCIALLMSSSVYGVKIESKTQSDAPNVTLVTLTLKPDNNERIYADTITISCNNPDVIVSPSMASKQPEVVYDNDYKKNMAVYESEVDLMLEAVHADRPSVVPSNLHISLITSYSQQPNTSIIPLSFSAHKKTSLENVKTSPSVQAQTSESSSTEEKQGFMKQWAKKVQGILTQTESWGLKLLFAFLLGLLMSLTPCIYPMIPITVGVLQSQGGTSLLRNFLLSSAYTLGLATTFAGLGFVAATSGSAFGHLMGNPIFVIAIVIVLAYFAFSMFGFYPLYIPRFLQQKKSFSNKGSFLSIFLFGLASGSVASPCLSPGLALVLTMVASMANKTLGFLLLFLFGIGVSFPLLIIGTFSSSLTVLPRAGMWMLEVQKFFGFMLLGMCLYYLSAIIPTVATQGLLTLFMMIIATYYYYNISSFDSRSWRYFKLLLSILAGAGALFYGTQTIQEYYYKKSVDHTASWYTDYDKAEADAQRENKKILLDFWAPYCSVCKLITKHVLQAPAVHRVLDQNYIVVSVNGNDAQSEPYKTLKDRYNVQGLDRKSVV